MATSNQLPTPRLKAQLEGSVSPYYSLQEWKLSLLPSEVIKYMLEEDNAIFNAAIKASLEFKNLVALHNLRTK